MKNNEQVKAIFSNVQAVAQTGKPSAPFTARQVVSDRRAPDPSSVLRSDRYPIPGFFEYRMRLGE